MTQGDNKTEQVLKYKEREVLKTVHQNVIVRKPHPRGS